MEFSKRLAQLRMSLWEEALVQMQKWYLYTTSILETGELTKTRGTSAESLRSDEKSPKLFLVESLMLLCPALNLLGHRQTVPL